MVPTNGLRKLVTVTQDTKPPTTGEAPTGAAEEGPWLARAWDDKSGLPLDANEVKRARELEMRYIAEKEVWRKVPRAAALRNGWKIIPTRWIDINKGTAQDPCYRSRLVAKEFNTGAEEGLFAATPPLEAVRLLLSDVATVRQGSHSRSARVVMINDVARAFFEAPMQRLVCVELPPEARVAGCDDVGLLQMSLYGTRDAAANFQAEVRAFMLNAGFRASSYNPCVFYHPVKDLRTLVHGDDFLTSGNRQEAKWFREALEARFQIKSVVVGTGVGEVGESRILGRTIRVTPEGWEYEADPQHAENIVQELGLVGANGVKSPGAAQNPWEEEENGEPLLGSDVTRFRGLAARANYIAQDRTELQFAAKEICRGMAAPTVGHMQSLRRLGRFLVTSPRTVWYYPWQSEVCTLSAYSDSDWAGCRRTGRSTSGGVFMRGAHSLKTYSLTQKFVTLSSGEAELMAIVRATSEAIGLTQLAAGWGISLTAEIFCDSSAALAVTARRGSGKLRHVKVGNWWIQEIAAAGDAAFRKVAGNLNPADLCTKHLAAGVREALMPLLGQWPLARPQGGSSHSLNRLWCAEHAQRRRGVGNPVPFKHTHGHSG